MTKAELRKTYLQKRLSLGDAEYAQLNSDLCQTFFKEVNLTGIRILHAFLPIEKNKEVNTWLIIDKIGVAFPDIMVSIPKVNPETNELDNVFFEGRHHLSESAWGIPEPKHGKATNAWEIEMVLVPMLICDQQGHRVGYGKGFYDKFLSRCNPGCKKIGISFFEPVKEIKDVTALDVPIDCCVTPHKIYRFLN